MSNVMFKKMPESCVCYGCTNRRKTGKRVSFHKFPFDKPDLLRRWLANINRDEFYPTKHHRVCSEHFLSSDFMRGLHPRDDTFAIKHQLNYEAAPTVFPEHPQRKKQRRHLLRNGPHSKKIRKEKPDVQKLVLIKEELRPGVDQQDPEPVHIKEEDWTGLETEQLNGTITTDVSRFSFTANPLKSEDDEEEPFPHLFVHQVEDREVLTSRAADPMKTSAGGEGCAEIEITWNPDETDSCASETYISEVDDVDEDPDAQLSYSSTSEDGDGGWEESRGVNTVVKPLQRDVPSHSGRSSS